MRFSFILYSSFHSICCLFYLICWSSFPVKTISLQLINLLNLAPCFSQVLSDEGKRKQYDTYGSAGFDAGQASGGQHYWSGQASSIDPEELFRKIFGEFSGARGFGDFNAMFDQPQEVRHCKIGVKVKDKEFISSSGHFFIGVYSE